MEYQHSLGLEDEMARMGKRRFWNWSCGSDESAIRGLAPKLFQLGV